MLLADELRTTNHMEDQAKSLFRLIAAWKSHDNIVIVDGKKTLDIDDQIELWRKEHGLEKDDVAIIFVKSIQDHLSALETKSEIKTPKDWRPTYASLLLQYYPVPQKQFLELIQKTVELDPMCADWLISSYTKVYPDWLFDDKTILDLTSKSSKDVFNLRYACADLKIQVRKEKDEARKKKLLDKALEWAFQDDKLEFFYSIDRFLLDNYGKGYATNPARKLQLEKNLEMYEKEKYYGWIYRRTKYALEHFGEGDKAFKMLFQMDTDPKLRDGKWERSEREKRQREGFEEAEKQGIDLSTVLSPELYNKYKSLKESEDK